MKDLYLLTAELVTFVKQPLPEDHDERDAFLVKLDERLQKRESLLKKLDGDSFSPAERKLGDEIIKLNGRLNERLEQIQMEIRKNLADLKEKKKTGRKYENPYDGPTSEGIFFDKRGV
ncbi:flagellar protein [Alkalihalobacillus oceani]|uniref:flagellar protein n=1 Tax=Halalkalibacter oceani TaxID=1653776 RepID=UPI00203F4125|nr:flagellar protein [Halalkalibacter oceani]MCM3760677.1 flagellar protein [Halalkalibacter oceani]